MRRGEAYGSNWPPLWPLAREIPRGRASCKLAARFLARLPALWHQRRAHQRQQLQCQQRSHRMEAILRIQRKHATACSQLYGIFCDVANAREEALVVSIAQRLSPQEQAVIVAAYVAAEEDALSIEPALV